MFGWYVSTKPVLNLDHLKETLLAGLAETVHLQGIRLSNHFELYIYIYIYVKTTLIIKVYSYHIKHHDWTILITSYYIQQYSSHPWNGHSPRAQNGTRGKPTCLHRRFGQFLRLHFGLRGEHAWTGRMIGWYWNIGCIESLVLSREWGKYRIPTKHPWVEPQR